MAKSSAVATGKVAAINVRAKRCQPPNLGELGDLLAADAIAAQADASQAEPAPLVRMAWCTCRPSRGDGGVRRRPSERAGLLSPASLEARAASVVYR